jgi:hypothetical protein
VANEDSSTVVGQPSRAGRIVAALLAVFWGYLFYGLIDLLVFVQGPEFHASFHLETGWGLFFLFLVSAPLVAVAIAPRAVIPAALQQVLLSGVAAAVGAVLSASPPHLVVAAALGAAVLFVSRSLGFGGREVLRRPRRWAWGPGALVVAAAGPWFAYGLATAEAARAGRHPDQTWGLNHWPIQSALAIGIVLAAALVATFPRGWVVPAWSVGVCAIWLGVVSWIYPGLDASLGRAWATAAVAWGLAFVTVTHVAYRARGRPNAG